MKEKLTLQQILDAKMSDKDRWVALAVNYPDICQNEGDNIKFHMLLGQLNALVEAKQRLVINDSLLLSNGFEKWEGMGDDTNYQYEIMSPPLLGEQHVITNISFRHFEGDDYFYLFVEHKSSHSPECSLPNEMPIYNRIEVYVKTIQQAEDAINSVGFPFSFSLKGYKAE